MKLSLRQYCALDGQRNWVVSAGAGAGKTSVLTRRFLSLLEQDEDLHLGEILALTFTQKAAEEMKGRIYRYINSIVYGESISQRQLQRFQGLKEEFGDSCIRTFHSFCFHLLMSHPVEGQMDPGVHLMGDFEREQAVANAYSETLQQFIRRPKEGQLSQRNRQFLELLECWEQRQIRRRVLEMLFIPRRYISFVECFKRIAKNPDGFVEKTLEKAADFTFRKLFGDNFLPRLQELKVQLDASDSPLRALTHEIIEALEPIRNPVDLLNIRQKAETWLEHEAVLRQEKIRGGAITAVQIRKHLQESHLADLDGKLDRKGLEYLGLFIFFLNEVYLKYEEFCERNRLLDFDFLQLKALQLLENNSQVLNDARQRYRYVLVDEFQDTDPIQWQILRLLVSESPTGELAPNRLFIVGDEKQAIYGFRGGDIQVFRQASKELLAANPKGAALFFESSGLSSEDSLAGNQEKTNGEDLQNLSIQQQERIRNGDLNLNENFRSRKNLIDFFNHFSRLLFQPEKGLDPAPQDLQCMRQGDGGEGSVRILALPSDIESPGAEQRSVALHEVEAHFIAQFVKKVLEKENQENDKENFSDVRQAIADHRPGIAILLGRFTKIKIYEEVFRQHGIDFFVHRGKGFFRRQEILDLYNVLEFLNDTRKDINLIGLLRSSAFGLRDDALVELCRQKETATLFHWLRDIPEAPLKEIYQILYRWHQLKDRLRISELLRRIISDTSWNAVFGMGIRGNQTIQNVEKFIEMARKFEKEGIRGLADFCQFVRGQIDRDEKEGEAALDVRSSSGVVFMTIHRSKGLEFPMVILPDLNARFNFPKGDLLEAWEGEQGNEEFFYGITCPNPERNFVREPTLAKRILQEKVKNRLVAEEKRIFYVGATRAMDHLVLVGKAREKRKERKEGDLVGSVWDWIEDFSSLTDGVTEARVGEGGPPIAVEWCKKALPRFKEATDLVLPQFEDEKVNQVAGNYQLDTGAVEEPVNLRVAPSLLGVFEKCQRKFYYQRILGVPEFFVLQALQEKMSDEMDAGVDENSPEGDTQSEDWRREVRKVSANIRGLVVHKALENLSGGDADGIKSRVETLVLQNLQTVEPFTRQKINPKILQKEIFNHIDGFCGNEEMMRLFRDLEKKGESHILSEVAFENEIEGVVISGQIDKIYRQGGQWTILDFKTNRLPKKIRENSTAMGQWIGQNYYDLQLNCYALAAEEILGVGSVEKLQLYFTHESFGMVEVPLALEKVRQNLKNLRERFGNPNPILPSDTKPLTDSLCQNCGYRIYGICDYPKANEEKSVHPPAH